MRFLLSLLLMCFVLEAQNIQKEIQDNEARVKQAIQEQDRISKELKRLGAEIQKQVDLLLPLMAEIQILEQKIQSNHSKYMQQEQEMQRLLEQEKDFTKRSEEIQHQITQLLTRDLAFKIIANRKQMTSEEGMVVEEFLQAMNNEAKKRVRFLTQEKQRLEQETFKISREAERLRILLDEQNQKRNFLDQSITKRNQLIAKLQGDVQSYNQRMSAITKERENLDEILEKLNIKKRDLDKKARDDQLKKEHSEALAKKKREKNNDLIAPIDVKRMASSFRQISTTKYSGQKTIPPLESFSIDQKFGAYFDPVYKIKVFNESVILASKKSNANVRSVLDGKVVFAKETPVLKKVVIIEHANQIHTIYAFLDKIAPTIRPGLKIKKGYVIGKVDDKLSFEVTKKDKYIDPLELIGK